LEVALKKHPDSLLGQYLYCFLLNVWGRERRGRERGKRRERYRREGKGRRRGKGREEERGR